MNNDDLPITFEGREPDGFDDFVWHIFVIVCAASVVGMTGFLYAAISWLLGRFA